MTKKETRFGSSPITTMLSVGLTVFIMYRTVLGVQDVRSIVVSVDEETTYAVFVCATSRYGSGRVASLRFSTPRLDRPSTPPSTRSLIAFGSRVHFALTFIRYKQETVRKVCAAKM